MTYFYHDLCDTYYDFSIIVANYNVNIVLTATNYEMEGKEMNAKELT